MNFIQLLFDIDLLAFLRPFVLLSGTAVLIILLIAGSISLLYAVGEQALPSTLLATAINVQKE